MSGRVYQAEVRVNKPSELIEEGQLLSLRGEADSYVSRGAYKLLRAVEHFSPQIEGLVCIDLGAASGGFTDVLLRHGAKHVYAIDVGYGQFDYRLRMDERVTLWERTNARLLTKDRFELLPQLTVMDLSFISIRLILPTAMDIMGEGGRVLSLVKPQFEAGRGQVGKNGVVREKETHARVLREIRDFVHDLNWSVRGYCASPIKGPKGNIEFLADIQAGTGKAITDQDIQTLVMEAHRALNCAQADPESE